MYCHQGASEALSGESQASRLTSLSATHQEQAGTAGLRKKLFNRKDAERYRVHLQVSVVEYCALHK
jgi:phosphoglucomutase